MMVCVCVCVCVCGVHGSGMQGTIRSRGAGGGKKRRSGLAFAVGPVKQMHRPVESVFDEWHAIPYSTRSLALLVAAAEVVYIAVVTHREIHEQGRVETTEDTVEVVGLKVRALNADK